MFLRKINPQHCRFWLSVKSSKECVCVCVCVCVYIYIYIYTHTHTHTHAYKNFNLVLNCLLQDVIIGYNGLVVVISFNQ